jgi:hypothetical protein
VAKFPCFLD